MANPDAGRLKQFMLATVNDQGRARRMLRENPQLISCRDGVGETCLHYLVIENCLDAVKFLINEGADVNTRNDFKGTPLMDAAQLGHEEISRLLLAHGADPNAVDEIADTALLRAAWAGYPTMVGILMEAGADVHYRNDIGDTVLDVVSEVERDQVLAVLRRHGYEKG